MGLIKVHVPHLKALIHIMAYGEYEGLKIDSPEFRKMFTKEEVLKSKWYNA
jgi:phosphoenolpyruvate carboxykinase (diphosphate)